MEHTGGIEAFRGKWEWLSRYPDIELTVLAPETWIENYRLVRTSTGVRGYRIVTGRVAWRGYENRGFFYTGLVNAIRAARPDVLHLVEEQFSLFALQSAIVARTLFPGVKILFYTSDNFATGFRYSYRPGWAYGLIERAVHRLADCGVASCTDAGAVLRSRGFRKPLRFVPLSIDPERYRPEAARRFPGDRPFVIGYVGRLLPMKGLRVLGAALSQLEGDWRCLVLGAGPERERLEEMAVRGGWGDRLEIIEGVPHEKVPVVMGRMDCLVLPSLTTPLWREQFGRVLVEGMAAGIPVVGSDSGSIPEVMGDAGLVVPEGDPGALAGALRRLMENASLRSDLVRRGAGRVRRHFTWERAAAQFKEIYDGLLSGRLASEERPEWVTEPRAAEESPGARAHGPAAELR